MSELAFKPGDRVQTPAHGEGVVDAINRGPARGRQWRETCYAMVIVGLAYRVWYYESELTLLSSAVRTS